MQELARLTSKRIGLALSLALLAVSCVQNSTVVLKRESARLIGDGRFEDAHVGLGPHANSSDAEVLLLLSEASRRSGVSQRRREAF